MAKYENFTPSDMDRKLGGKWATNFLKKMLEDTGMEIGAILYNPVDKKFNEWLSKNIQYDLMSPKNRNKKYYLTVIKAYVDDKSLKTPADYGLTHKPKSNKKTSSPSPKSNVTVKTSKATPTEEKSQRAASNQGTNTEKQESLTCYYTAVFILKGDTPYETCIENDYALLKKCATKADAVPLYAVLTGLEKKRDHYHYSAWKHAKGLYKAGWLKPNQVAYHDNDKAVTDISGIKKKGSKLAQEYSKIKIQGTTYSSNIKPDKYNPADMWLVSDMSLVRSIIKDSKTIQEYNQRLQNAMYEKKIIGVSLKLIEADDVLVKTYNYHGKAAVGKYELGVTKLSATGVDAFIKNKKTSIFLHPTRQHVQDMRKGKLHGEKFDLDTKPFQNKIQFNVGGYIRGSGRADTSIEHIYRINYFMGVQNTLPNFKQSQYKDKIQEIINSPDTIKVADGRTILDMASNLFGYSAAKDLLDAIIKHRDTVQIHNRIAAIWFVYKLVGLPKTDRDNVFRAYIQFMEAETDFSGPFVKVF